MLLALPGGDIAAFLRFGAVHGYRRERLAPLRAINFLQTGMFLLSLHLFSLFYLPFLARHLLVLRKLRETVEDLFSKG